MSEKPSFFVELKRRNVYKAAVAYVVAGWALAQGLAQVLPVSYVVVPINLRYNDKGQLVKRTGLMTLALHKGVDGWRITAWAWTWG